MFRKKTSKPVFPPPVPENIIFPKLNGFRYITDFFPRSRAEALLGRLAAYHQQIGLPQDYTQTVINLVAHTLVFAGKLAQAHNLPEGDCIVLYLAVIYAYMTPPSADPVFHTLLNARLAGDEIRQWKFTESAAVRVARALKEYSSGDKVLKTRLLRAMSRTIHQAADPRQVVYRAVTGIMERQDAADVWDVLKNLEPTEQKLYEALCRYFADEVYPLPSTPERWEYAHDFVQEPGIWRIRLYSVGSPGGHDWDYAMVNVPLLKKMRIAVGPLELFINDTNAAVAIEARKAMDLVYARRPKLYEQWKEDKGQAAALLEAGQISKKQYNAFKALWHRERGLPWMHYGWKMGDETLPDSLEALIPAREGGYNQIPLLLHDCLINPLPTPQADWWIGGKKEGLVLDVLTAAVERMNTAAAKAILTSTIEEFETKRSGRKTRVAI